MLLLFWRICIVASLCRNKPPGNRNCIGCRADSRIRLEPCAWRTCDWHIPPQEYNCNVYCNDVRRCAVDGKTLENNKSQLKLNTVIHNTVIINYSRFTFFNMSLKLFQLFVLYFLKIVSTKEKSNSKIPQWNQIKIINMGLLGQANVQKR